MALTIKDFDVMGFRMAVKAMRAAYESWDRSDSFNKLNVEQCELGLLKYMEFKVGEKDLELAKKLVKAGSEHRKFIRYLHVQIDMVAPRYWWTQFDTYKVGTTSSSSSTMHLLGKRELTEDDFSFAENPIQTYSEVVNTLNIYIKAMKSAKEAGDMETRLNLFMALKSILPEGFNQERIIDLNYETLLTIYRQRKSHRLGEWRTFCDFIESLPLMEEFIGAIND